MRGYGWIPDHVLEEKKMRRLAIAGNLVNRSGSLQNPSFRVHSLISSMKLEGTEFREALQEGLKSAIDAGLLSFQEAGNFSFQPSMDPNYNMLPLVVGRQIYFVLEKDCGGFADKVVGFNLGKVTKHGDYPIKEVPSVDQWKELYLKYRLENEFHLVNILLDKGILSPEEKGNFSVVREDDSVHGRYYFGFSCRSDSHKKRLNPYLRSEENARNLKAALEISHCLEGRLKIVRHISCGKTKVIS